MGATAKIIRFEVTSKSANDSVEELDTIGLEQSGERPIARLDEATPESAPRFDSFFRVIPQGPAFEESVDCFGVGVAKATWEHLRDWFYEAARTRSREPRTMYFANAHTLNLAWNDADFRAVLNRADVVLNDGIGVQIYSRLARSQFVENFNGTDLLPRLFAEATAEDPIRVFLYGAAKGRAELAAANLEKRFPGVKIVGTMDGYSRTSVIETINETCPDVVLVGMGNPVQERWIDENKALLDVGIVVGVGALIDFLSGVVSRAPKAVRAMRLEWAYRLAREPKRLFKRYVLGNPAFLVRAVLYLVLGLRPAATAVA